jgi:hypothetical protein
MAGEPRLASAGGKLDGACGIGDSRRSRMRSRETSDTHVNINAESEV